MAKDAHDIPKAGGKPTRVPGCVHDVASQAAWLTCVGMPPTLCPVRCTVPQLTQRDSDIEQLQFQGSRRLTVRSERTYYDRRGGVGSGRRRIHKTN
jgi:hypothetical protein